MRALWLAVARQISARLPARSREKAFRLESEECSSARAEDFKEGHLQRGPGDGVAGGREARGARRQPHRLLNAQNPEILTWRSYTCKSARPGAPAASPTTCRMNKTLKPLNLSPSPRDQQQELHTGSPAASPTACRRKCTYKGESVTTAGNATVGPRPDLRMRSMAGCHSTLPSWKRLPGLQVRLKIMDLSEGWQPVCAKMIMQNQHQCLRAARRTRGRGAPTLD